MPRLLMRRRVKDGVTSKASYSPCETYRYRLSRVWDEDGPHMTWIMLNPSTATEAANDPTIERCERRSRAAGMGGYSIVNLFGFRATDPRDLKRASDPVGPDNDRVIRAAVRASTRVIAAWGVHGDHRGRHEAVKTLLRRLGQPVCHVGLTKDGHPRHPLYVAYSTTPQPWAMD